MLYEVITLFLGVKGLLFNMKAIEPCVAGRQPGQAGQDADGGGFPGTVGADHPDNAVV